MHDPTEGGLNMGCVELAAVSNCGCLIDESKIPFIEHCKELCSIFDIDPMRLITSGTLICAVKPDDAQKLVEILEKNNVIASIIGELTTQDQGFRLKSIDGKVKDLIYSETDEILKIFKE
jgi:hydrogenase maturation factor